MSKNVFICDCNCIHHEVVAHVRNEMPQDKTFMVMAEFYKNLADPTRCKIIFALQNQELCVCDLANILSMTKSSISHQLSKMRTSGVVKCRRAGKEVYYSLNDHHISDIFTTTLTHIRRCIP